jgi:hypothetical protein
VNHDRSENKKLGLRMGLIPILDPNILLRRLPPSFTMLMVATIISLKVFTVISTYLIVIMYRLRTETNPISNTLGITPYMLSSATIVSLATYVSFKRVSKEKTFPLLFGIFLMTLFDAANYATVGFSAFLLHSS